ncbi:MAG: PRC-barrel domain-containing protein [Candidatus Berkelbacteria bacterium]
MITQASKLIHLPVAAEDALSKVGIIKDIIVDPETGVLLGFLVIVGLFTPAMALSVRDIKFWDQDAIITASEENLVNPAEIIRIKHVLDQKINLMNLPAETENGKSLGFVEDFIIDTETESVTAYHLRDLLGSTRIIPADKVIKIDQKIIFQNDDETINAENIGEVSLA